MAPAASRTSHAKRDKFGVYQAEGMACHTLHGYRLQPEIFGSYFDEPGKEKSELLLKYFI